MGIEDLKGEAEQQTKAEQLQDAIERYYFDSKPGEVRFMALSDYVMSLHANDETKNAQTEEEKLKAIATAGTLEAVIAVRSSGTEGYAKESSVVETLHYHLGLFISEEFPRRVQSTSMATEILDDIVIKQYNRFENEDETEIMAELHRISSVQRPE